MSRPDTTGRAEAELRKAGGWSARLIGSTVTRIEWEEPRIHLDVEVAWRCSCGGAHLSTWSEVLEGPEDLKLTHEEVCDLNGDGVTITVPLELA